MCMEKSTWKNPFSLHDLIASTGAFWPTFVALPGLRDRETGLMSVSPSSEDIIISPVSSEGTEEGGHLHLTGFWCQRLLPAACLILKLHLKLHITPSMKNLQTFHKSLYQNWTSWQYQWDMGWFHDTYCTHNYYPICCGHFLKYASHMKKRIIDKGRDLIAVA